MKIKKINKARKETKYFVNSFQRTLLSSLFKSILTLDENDNDKGRYLVRSIYFDTIDNKDFYEKEMGVKKRQKIRVRYYNNDLSTLKFEVKEKDDKHTLKHRIDIDKYISIELFNGDFNSILEEGRKKSDDSLIRVYEHLTTNRYMPKSIVDYEREAYTHPNFDIRVNFDSNIRGIKFTENVFDENITMIPLIDPDISVLEIKHSGHLPGTIQQVLAVVDLTQVTYSKHYNSIIKSIAY